MSECYCDYEPAQCYVVTKPHARKQHKCDECGGLMLVGEEYERVFAVWDGSAGNYRTCKRCLDLREWVKAHIPCFCWYHQNMLEDAMETAKHWSHEAPGLLFGAYRRQVAIHRHRDAQRIKSC
jgi:hypothetical protein